MFCVAMKLTSLNLIHMKLKVDHAQRAQLQSHDRVQNELYRFGSNKVMLLSNIYGFDVISNA